MTRSAPRPCQYPGCGVLVPAGRCEKHVRKERAQLDERRGSSSSRGYDYRWRKLRDAHLTQNPLCVNCAEKGLIEQAEEVDHIVPFQGKDDRLRLDPHNLQSLCGPCHRVKTAHQGAPPSRAA